jgi:hypothetical protein
MRYTNVCPPSLDINLLFPPHLRRPPLHASTAPGEMHTRGGSEGGLGLMDAARSQATHQPNTLAERNLPPSDEGGRLGNSEAWKHRK